MPDIIITTPKSMMREAAQEAEDAKRSGGGYYFRSLHSPPRDLNEGDRVFYVEDGYIRGFCTVDHLSDSSFGGHICQTTGRHWSGACFVFMRPNSWTWIRPIPKKGFQGWRYYTAPADLEILGDWMAPRPSLVA